MSLLVWFGRSEKPNVEEKIGDMCVFYGEIIKHCCAY